MLGLDRIQALHIELTTNCNARCPMCMRNYRGSDFNAGYPITELSLDQIQKIFSPDFLKQIKHVNFNGNLGDFGLARDAHAVVEYFLTHSPARIQINTNGSMRTPAWWAQLAHARVRIQWALDGLADTHALYRQDTDWHRVIAHAQAFIEAGGHAIWKFIPFEHNRHQQEQCRELSEQMGFRGFTVLDRGRNQGPVFSRQGEFSHWLGQPDTRVPQVQDLIQDHLTWFDPAVPITWIQDESARINCEHKKRKEIYVAADGSVYPCCYLGYFPETMSHPGNSQIRPLVKDNNALLVGLEAAMAWFDQVEQTWKQSSIASGRLFTCVQNCAAR